MATITPAALHRLLGENPAAAVIDVRTPIEFAEVRATPARNLPLDTLDPADIPAGKPVYILCRSGQRAAKAAALLAPTHTPIVVEGGTLAWIEAGLPVIHGEKKIISLERQIRIAAGSLVLAGVLLGFLLHPAFFLLSGFVGAGLVFAGLTGWCGLGLLIAKAPWNNK